MPVAADVEVEFVNAGHLLGSSYARVRTGGRTILFGGDLGRFNRPVLPDPTMIAEADYLLVESTYGNRVHAEDDDGSQLAEVIAETAVRGGRVIVPAFAIGRVEELIYWVKRLEEQQRIPVLPVFVDSPMAIEALARYTERMRELDPEMQPEARDEKAPHGPADHRDPPAERRRHARHERQICAFCTERFRTIATPAESRQLTQSKTPSIIISASGMATGGRVLHHLKAALPDARNTVLFVGYQAAGTRGRQLVDGEKTVKIHGEIDSRATPRSASSNRCRPTPTPTRSSTGSADSRNRRARPSSCTGSRLRWTRSARLSPPSSAGRRKCRSTERRCSWSSRQWSMANQR